MVAEIDVKDPDGYTEDFQPKAQANIKEAGRYHAVGRLGAGQGDTPNARKLTYLLSFC
jgi:hypothetical protein